MKNQLQILANGDYANYRAAGLLDGYESDVYASKACNYQIRVHFGPLALTLSVDACRELAAHLNAALEAQQTAGGISHE